MLSLLVTAGRNVKSAVEAPGDAITRMDPVREQSGPPAPARSFGCWPRGRWRSPRSDTARVPSPPSAARVAASSFFASPTDADGFTIASFSDEQLYAEVEGLGVLLRVRFS